MLRASLAALIVLVSACGGGGTTAPSAAPAAAGAKEITIQNSALSAKTLEVPVGTKVTWTNKDSSAHTATSGAPNAADGKFDSGSLAQNATFSFTFAQAGTYSYFCTRHPTTAALMGTITVK